MNFRIILYLSFIFLCCNTSQKSNETINNSTSKNNIKSKSMKYDYIFDLNATACNYEVGINGFVVFQEKEGASLAVEEAVNQWITKGMNTLDVKVSPLANEYLGSSKLEIKLIQRNFDTPSEQTVLSQYQFSYLVEKKTMVISEKVPFDILQLPFSSPIFSTKPIIDITNKKILSKAAKKYEEIYKLFEQKDVEKILQQFEVRQRDLAKSFYKTPQQMSGMLEQSIKSDFSNPTNVLILFKPENLRPLLSCNGKVLGLEYLDAGLHPITFWDTEAQMQSIYEIYLCLDENNNFFICR